MNDKSPGHRRGASRHQGFEIWAYPIAILSDRYGGTYSGGKWIAVAGLEKSGLGEAVLRMLAHDGEDMPNPWGSDGQAGDFWSDPPKWIAAGNTPDEAVAALKAKNAGANGPFDGRRA